MLPVSSACRLLRLRQVQLLRALALRLCPERRLLLPPVRLLPSLPLLQPLLPTLLPCLLRRGIWLQRQALVRPVVLRRDSVAFRLRQSTAPAI